MKLIVHPRSFPIYTILFPIVPCPFRRPSSLAPNQVTSNPKRRTQSSEHRVTPTPTWKQDILRKLRPKLPKLALGHRRTRLNLFDGSFSSFQFGFTLCFGFGHCHCFCLLQTEGFESFLLSLFTCCFFRQGDAGECVSTITDVCGRWRKTGLTLSSPPWLVSCY